MDKSVRPDVAKAIAEHVFAGRKIEAIRLYREQTDKGLKESKDFVDALEKELRAREPGRFTASPAGKGCLGMIVVWSAGILAVVIVILARFW